MARKAHPQYVPLSALPPSLLLRRCTNFVLRLVRGRVPCCPPTSSSRWRAWWEGCGTCVEDSLDWLIRTLGPLYIIIAIVLIGSVVFLYFTLLLPAAYGYGPRWKAALHVAGALWLTANVLTNYVLCIITDPGSPPQEPGLMAYMAAETHKARREQGLQDSPGPPQRKQAAQRGSTTVLGHIPPSALAGPSISVSTSGGSSFSSDANAHARASAGSSSVGSFSGAENSLQGFLEGRGKAAPTADIRDSVGPSVAEYGPGPSHDDVPAGAAAESAAPLLPLPANLPTTFRWCKLCKRRKGPMTHHCYVCKRCVLKMDHHCPWMNNCVGYRNYRYFFCFVLNLWMGCLYAVQISSSLLLNVHRMETGVLFTFVVALAVFMALCLLLFWHVYLVATSQTTIDFYGHRQKAREAKRMGTVWKNEYDLGLLRNFVVVLQLTRPLWGFALLLPMVVHMRGDGMTFPTAQPPAGHSESEEDGDFGGTGLGVPDRTKYGGKLDAFV